MINPPVVPCPGGTFYTVRAGDTLYRIARRYNLTVAQLLEANPNMDPNRLMIGQQICIPVAPVTCTGFTYTVVAGDTLFTIAARYNTTIQAILAVNPGLDPNRLFIGQQICIPVPAPACPGFVYTIAAGDTLFALASRYNTTVPAILAANPGLDPNRLFIGQQICIPVPAPAPACPGFVHTIVAGDTLFVLASRYNTTVQAILAANPGLDPNRLFIGQQICIPVPMPPACPGFVYAVVAGDTLNAIAVRFNTTVPAILAANPGLNPDFIAVGQSICIPVPRLLTGGAEE